MLNTIWEHYFLQQFLRIFFLFLFCFYGLYVLIDYASHTSTLASHHVHIKGHEVARYYLYVFASRAEILIPLALLIAFIKTICSLNTHHELVALQASGFKLKTLMRPFLCIGFLCLLLMYLNEQFLLPEALKKLRRIESYTKHQKHRHSPHLTARPLVLEDGSLLVFQDYDAAKEQFFDVYWIQSIDSIYRMKYLSPHLPTPKGTFVDHLVRQPNGELIQQTADAEMTFPTMQFNSEIVQSTLLEPDILSLSELVKQTTSLSPELNEKESKVLTALYWKLVIPWLCLLAILAPAPFCVRFSRQLPIFLIYACSLFGLIAFYLLMDASQVIAKRQVIPPFWAIWSPFLSLFSFFSWRFIKME